MQRRFIWFGIYTFLVLTSLTAAKGLWKTKKQELEVQNHILRRVKRSPSQFHRAIRCFQPSINVVGSYGNYGCYCGLSGYGLPIDDTDKCCYVHDNCYAEANHVKQTWWESLVSVAGHIVPSYNNKCENSSVICESNTPYQNKLCECDKAAAECFYEASKKYHPQLLGIDTATYCKPGAKYDDLNLTYYENRYKPLAYDVEVSRDVTEDPYVQIKHHHSTAATTQKVPTTKEKSTKTAPTSAQKFSTKTEKIVPPKKQQSTSIATKSREATTPTKQQSTTVTAKTTKSRKTTLPTKKQSTKTAATLKPTQQPIEEEFVVPNVVKPKNTNFTSAISDDFDVEVDEFDVKNEKNEKRKKLRPRHIVHRPKSSKKNKEKKKRNRKNEANSKKKTLKDKKNKSSSVTTLKPKDLDLKTVKPTKKVEDQQHLVKSKIVNLTKSHTNPQPSKIEKLTKKLEKNDTEAKVSNDPSNFQSVKSKIVNLTKSHTNPQPSKIEKLTKKLEKNDVEAKVSNGPSNFQSEQQPPRGGALPSTQINISLLLFCLVLVVCQVPTYLCKLTR